MYASFFFQAEDGIRDGHVTGVQTCALPISIEYPDRIFNKSEAPYEELKVLLNKYKADIEDPVLSNLPLVSGFIGSCSFDLVRHAFTKLREIEVKNTTDDLLFYMVESVYIFDHYKEKIHVITRSEEHTSELQSRGHLVC